MNTVGLGKLYLVVFFAHLEQAACRPSIGTAVFVLTHTVYFLVTIYWACAFESKLGMSASMYLWCR